MALAADLTLAKVGVEGSNPFARSKFSSKDQKLTNRAATAARAVFRIPGSAGVPRDQVLSGYVRVPVELPHHA